MHFRQVAIFCDIFGYFINTLYYQDSNRTIVLCIVFKKIINTRSAKGINFFLISEILLQIFINEVNRTNTCLVVIPPLFIVSSEDDHTTIYWDETMEL